VVINALVKGGELILMEGFIDLAALEGGRQGGRGFLIHLCSFLALEGITNTGRKSLNLL